MGRQHMVQACGEGVAGLYGLARQETLAIGQAQLVSRERVRRQMLVFACHRGDVGAQGARRANFRVFPLSQALLTSSPKQILAI